MCVYVYRRMDKGSELFGVNVGSRGIRVFILVL